MSQRFNFDVPDAAKIADIGGVAVAINAGSGFGSGVDLTHFIKQFPESKSSPELLIEASVTGLECVWIRQNQSVLKLQIDVEKFVKQQGSYPAPKQGAFNQALGKKSKHILDATAGWAGDALLMCSQGYQVTLLERHPVMALLIEDAMWRLSQTTWAIDNQIKVPQLIHCEAARYLKENELGSIYDCVYLDPMFPAKKKKSAATNKYMQFLQWLVGEDLDAAELAEQLMKGSFKRIVVKRPSYAEPLYTKPFTQFSSKLVHFDVYL